MLRLLNEKPDGLFDDLALPANSFVIYCDGAPGEPDYSNGDPSKDDSLDWGVYSLAVIISPDGAAVHIEIKRWTPALAQSAKRDWQNLLIYLKMKHDVSQVVAMTSKSKKPMFDKFIKMFGFPPTEEILFSRQEV